MIILLLYIHFPPVGVAVPWATKTFVPQSSTVSVNCTSSSRYSLYWATELPDSSSDATFSNVRSLLNSKGFYEMPSVVHNSETTIRLLINSTTGINGTILKCVKGVDAIQETYFIVYRKSYLCFLQKGIILVRYI